MPWIVLITAAAACFWVAENTRDIRKLNSRVADIHTDLAGVSESVETVSTEPDIEKVIIDIEMLKRKVARLEQAVAELKSAGTAGNKTGHNDP